MATTVTTAVTTTTVTDTNRTPQHSTGVPNPHTRSSRDPLEHYYPMILGLIVVIIILAVIICIFRWTRAWLHAVRLESVDRGQPITGNATSNQSNPLFRNDSLRRKLINLFLFESKKSTETKLEDIEKGLMNKKHNDCVSCSVCFEEYSGDPRAIMVGFLKKCGHYYHFDCIWEWLERKRTCPLCREVAKLDEEDIKGISLAELFKTLNQAEDEEEEENRKHGKSYKVVQGPNKQELDQSDGNQAYTNAAFYHEGDNGQVTRHHSRSSSGEKSTLQESEHHPSARLSRSSSSWPEVALCSDENETEIDDDVLDFSQAQPQSDCRISMPDNTEKQDAQTPIEAGSSTSQPASSRSRQMDPNMCVLCKLMYHKDPRYIVVGTLSGCGHYFHYDCILHYVAKKRRCPICRIPRRHCVYPVLLRTAMLNYRMRQMSRARLQARYQNTHL